MGRGRSKVSVGGGGAWDRTKEQDKTLNQIARKTANLKNEQYRIVDSEGNVVLEKHGTRGEVATTVGEKREFLDGNISIHNHPAEDGELGGTFSPDDLGQFGFGAKEIVVSAPEGTYRLINTKYGTMDQYNGWYDMKNEIIENIETPAVDKSYLTRRKEAMESLMSKKSSDYYKATKQQEAITNKYSEISRTQGREKANEYITSQRDRYDSLGNIRQKALKREMRRQEVEPYHEYYKQNARKYGFEYKFEPRK